MINTLTFWVLIGIVSTVITILLLLVIYRKIRFEIFKIVGFILLILAITFNGQFAFAYLVSSEQNAIYDYLALSLAIFSLLYISLGIVSTNRRWINRRGTTRLNRFRNLYFFAYVRHPITFGLMIISTSLMLIIHTIFSNVFAALALVAFMISSLEKDSFFEKTYGYPYKVYTNHVPRFNIVYGLIKSLIIKQKGESVEKEQIITYD